MKSTVLVVADLACLKAYRFDSNPAHSTPRLELLEAFHFNGAQERLVDRVTDQSGRFPRGGGGPNSSAAMSAGERHNIELEHRRRIIRQLAGRLGALLNCDDVEHCLLAASREINRQLVEELPSSARDKIRVSLSSDLTKVDKSDLLWHFEI